MYWLRQRKKRAASLSKSLAFFFIVRATIGLGITLLTGCQQPAGPAGHRGLTFDVSPQGDKIVFPAKGKGFWDLYLLDLHTLKVTRLTETDAWEQYPRFSPDGQWIVYSATVHARNIKAPSHLFIRSVDGKEVYQLTQERGASDWAPMFTPDGSWILFWRSEKLEYNPVKGYRWSAGRAYVMDRVGRNVRRWPIDSIGEISPDNTKMFYVTVVAPSDYRKKIVSIDAQPLLKGRKPPLNSRGEPLGKELGVGSEPVWSPDGKRIAFISDKVKRYQYEIWVIDADGQNARQLTRLKRYTQCVRFVPPKGQRILFLALGNDGFEMKMDLWEVDVESKHLKRIADYRLFDDPLNWKP